MSDFDKKQQELKEQIETVKVIRDQSFKAYKKGSRLDTEVFGRESTIKLSVANLSAQTYMQSLDILHKLEQKLEVK